MKIRDIMTRPVWTARTGEPLSEAARRMDDKDVGSLPVVGPQERLVGILTDRDVAIAAAERDLPMSKLRVSDAMSHRVFVCRPTDSVEVAQRLLASHRVHRVPVVDEDGRLVGILSLGDLARAADLGEGISALDVVRVMTAVSAPLHSFAG